MKSYIIKKAARTYANQLIAKIDERGFTSTVLISAVLNAEKRVFAHEILIDAIETSKQERWYINLSRVDIQEISDVIQERGRELFWKAVAEREYDVKNREIK